MPIMHWTNAVIYCSVSFSYFMLESFWIQPQVTISIDGALLRHYNNTSVVWHIKVVSVV